MQFSRAFGSAFTNGTTDDIRKTAVVHLIDDHGNLITHFDGSVLLLLSGPLRPGEVNLPFNTRQIELSKAANGSFTAVIRIQKPGRYLMRVQAGENLFLTMSGQSGEVNVETVFITAGMQFSVSLVANLCLEERAPLDVLTAYAKFLSPFDRTTISCDFVYALGLI